MFNRNKKFQMLFEMGDNAVFAASNRRKDVDKWIEMFHKNGIVGSSIKIFSAASDGTHALIHAEACVDDEDMRPVGFGRWQS